MPADSDAMFLGKLLRRARLTAGIRSAEALAEQWGYERTVIAKAESGQRPPSPELARKYAERFPELNALVESGLIEEWAEHVRQTGGAILQRNWGKWIDNEKDATTLFYWAPVLIPGILQTEAYARELLETTPSDEPLDVRLAERMSRKEVLSRPHSPVVSAVISEAVLHRSVGGPEIMREQLTYLANNGHPKVMIQVIPAEIAEHAGLEGGGSIAEHEGGPTIVYLDSLAAPQTTGEPEIVANVREITGLLRAEALPRGASRDLILRLADELYGKPELAEVELQRRQRDRVRRGREEPRRRGARPRHQGPWPWPGARVHGRAVARVRRRHQGRGGSGIAVRTRAGRGRFGVVRRRPAVTGPSTGGPGRPRRRPGS